MPEQQKFLNGARQHVPHFKHPFCYYPGFDPKAHIPKKDIELLKEYGFGPVI